MLMADVWIFFLSIRCLLYTPPGLWIIVFTSQTTILLRCVRVLHTCLSRVFQSLAIREYYYDIPRSYFSVQQTSTTMPCVTTVVECQRTTLLRVIVVCRVLLSFKIFVDKQYKWLGRMPMAFQVAILYDPPLNATASNRIRCCVMYDSEVERENYFRQIQNIIGTLKNFHSYRRRIQIAKSCYSAVYSLYHTYADN